MTLNYPDLTAGFDTCMRHHQNSTTLKSRPLISTRFFHWLAGPEPCCEWSEWFITQLATKTAAGITIYLKYKEVVLCALCSLIDFRKGHRLETSCIVDYKLWL